LRLGTRHAQASSAAERTATSPRAGERVTGPGGLPFLGSGNRMRTESFPPDHGWEGTLA